MIIILTLLSGGTGTPKLLQGLTELVPQEEITVIANTGEDVEVSGLRVSPDLDTVIYTLAGIIDDEKWYGVKEDTFQTHNTLAKIGHKELLKIGDKDRAIKLYRTLKTQKGTPPSQISEEIRQALNVQAKVLPMSDDHITTKIITNKGEMPFHKYWIEREAKDKVKDVKFSKSNKAKPAPGVIKSLKQSHTIIIGPSNPITSIGPILSVNKIRSTLEENRDKVLAISPVIGNAPVSGPTGHLMEGLGHEVNPKGVASIYQDFVSEFILHEKDDYWVSEVENLNMNAHLFNILIPDLSSRVSLAQKILNLIDY